MRFRTTGCVQPGAYSNQSHGGEAVAGGTNRTIAFGNDGSHLQLWYLLHYANTGRSWPWSGILGPTRCSAGPGAVRSCPHILRCGSCGAGRSTCACARYDAAGGSAFTTARAAAAAAGLSQRGGAADRKGCGENELNDGLSHVHSCRLQQVNNNLLLRIPGLF